jgi:uncharacterized damage-inducible protein DinB
VTPALDRLFLDFSTSKLTQLTTRIRDCLGRLSDAHIWVRGTDNQNAVGNLVLHLCGNLRQWIISGVGGAPDLRRRPEEFAARAGLPGPELAERLDATVREAVAIIRALTPERLLERVVIQGYDVSKLEAVLHVLEHFAQHTGQIIFATKLLTGADLGYYRHLDQVVPPVGHDSGLVP